MKQVLIEKIMTTMNEMYGDDSDHVACNMCGMCINCKCECAMKKLIGLSLSFCVKDICKGLIPIESVFGIVPNFDWKATTLEAINDHYSHIYWKDFPEKAWEVLNSVKLLDRHPHGVNIADGCWMDSESYSPEVSLGYKEGTELAYQDQNIGADLKMTTNEAVLFLVIVNDPVE